MRSARLRTLLTLMGIIIGVASVVLTISLGEGITSQTLRQIDSNNQAQVVVIPGVPIERRADGSIRGIDLAGLIGASTITERDIIDIAAIDRVETVVPFAIITASPTTPAKEQLPGIFVASTTPDAQAVLGKELTSGSFFDEEEMNRNIAIIGRDVAIAYFEDDEPIGRSLSIRGSEFIVRGVLDSFERSGIQLDSTLIPQYLSRVTRVNG